MSDQNVPRRTFLKLAALGGANVALTDCTSGGTILQSPAPPAAFGSAGVTGLNLGVASYSLRNFSRAQAIQMTKELGTRFINLKSVHLPYETPLAEISAARQEIEASGLQIAGGGLITFEADTDDGVRKYFDYARAAGMPLIVGSCKPTLLPRIERFVKEYNIKLAIHNHGPGDVFPSPYDALKAVEGMDARMGLCIDLGHSVRAGTDVVRAVADAGPRVFDMHAKDLRDLHVAESQCIVGEGKIPIAAIFRQLEAIRYGGYVNLEYEIEPDNPMPGMKQSFAYMRGVLSGLG